MRHGIGLGWWMWLAVGSTACAGAAVAPPAAAPTPRFTGPGMPALAPVRPGLDLLATDSLAWARGRRIGLVTNVAAVGRDGVGAVQRLRAAGLTLVALFGPEHGLSNTAAPGEKVASGVDSATAIPIYSLYGRTMTPSPEMLRGIDLLVIDLPDVGARYYTYLATTVEVMKAAAPLGIPVLILDRPNPVGGRMQGNILDTAFVSPVGRLAVPMRHGLTLGEEARLAKHDLGIAVDLRVLPVSGWTRGMIFDLTGLPFRAPSPNLKDVDALLHYPGTCLFEGTAFSVGRGTDHPFHQIGAPWLDTARVLRIMRDAKLPGVTYRAVVFTPRQPGDAKFADTTVVGIRLIVTDPSVYDPTRTAVHLLAAVQAVHPDRARIGGSFDRLAGGRTLREALLRGDAPDDIVASWGPGLETYRERVKPFLLYPER